MKNYDEFMQPTIEKKTLEFMHRRLPRFISMILNNPPAELLEKLQKQYAQAGLNIQENDIREILIDYATAARHICDIKLREARDERKNKNA